MLLGKVSLTRAGARHAGQTNFYLKEIYTPVKEEHHEQDLTVEGSLPEDVDGVFLRVGPNPFYPPTGDYHMASPTDTSEEPAHGGTTAYDTFQDILLRPVCVIPQEAYRETV